MCTVLLPPGDNPIAVNKYIIFPTNERLAAIGLTDTSSCVHCGHLDTLQLRIVDCGERPVIWYWTRARIAVILRTDPRWISVEWTLRPDFEIWPPQRGSSHIDPGTLDCLQPGVHETPLAGLLEES